jgi:hypothetical protein
MFNCEFDNCRRCVMCFLGCMSDRCANAIRGGVLWCSLVFFGRAGATPRHTLGGSTTVATTAHNGPICVL